ncbi:lipopolysaccharide biosynthesis protein [Pseudarthrobacter quantipunctorum]|uniref:Oligosaccharide flippase family protein n=1 Tax=Pseudarthrobacter quantipunctorum TaxID=3128980 RepID=A0ABZ2RB92_9MICC
MRPWGEKVKKSIGIQAVALALTAGCAQIIVALLYIISARSTEPENFGLVVTAIAVGTTAVGFLDFGTNSLWVREIASSRLDPRTLGRKIASKLLYAFAALGVSTTLTAMFFGPTNIWMAGPVAMCLLVSQSIQVPLRGHGRGDLVALANLIDKLTAACIFALLLALNVVPSMALWVCLAAGALSSALFAWKITPRENRGRLSLRRLVNPWAGSRHYGVANVAITAQSLDIPAMTIFGGPGAAGIYAAVSRWTQPMGLLASAFSSASAPHVARASSLREAWIVARRSSWLLVTAMALSLAVAAFAPVVVDLLIGPDYAGSADVLRIMALTTIVGIANQPLFVFLQSRGFDKPVAVITVAGIIIQLGLVVILSNQFSAVGAAVAFACSQLFLFISMSIVLTGARSRGKRGVKTVTERLAKTQ